MESKIAKVTIGLDATLLRRAQVKALEDGTSLSSVLRKGIEEYLAGASSAASAKQSLLRLSAASRGRGGRRFSREERHERG